MNQSTKLDYCPDQLLDRLIRLLNLRNDKDLSRKLKVAPGIIKQIRRKRLPIGASMLMWMQEASKLSISELRFLMGDRRRTFRLICHMPAVGNRVRSMNKMPAPLSKHNDDQ